MESVDEFRKWGHELVDWMAAYFAGLSDLPVKSTLEPGDVYAKIPGSPPQQGEPFEQIFSDFQSLILPGMTHWQHPSFFAYFPANNSFPSILAEMITAAIGAQCMSWQTSPAATELEERVMEWLAQTIGIPPSFAGVIQDTASTATLCSLLTAREVASDFAVNRDGFAGRKAWTIYCSSEAHSSIEKAVKIAGFGQSHLRKVPVDETYSLIPIELEKMVKGDRKMGYKPLAVVAAVGTTGSTAIDPLKFIAPICRREKLWLHVDAAYAGSALVLPEYHWMIEGIEQVDSFVFNPHKWLFTNFDCSAYFVKDKSALIRTFEILPEYLKTREGHRVNNYRDWGLQLGRRFRALKLWFVLRSFGIEGLKEKIRNHIQWARELADTIDGTADFERLAPAPLGTVCFRFRPNQLKDNDSLNSINLKLLEAINASGSCYLTHTKLSGSVCLRLVVGQTRVSRDDVFCAWSLISRTARALI